MALIQPSALIDDIRGSVGNNTFQQGPTGLSVKPRKAPKNPRTSRQTSHRQAVAQLGAIWLNLSTETRDAWAEWTKTVPRTNRLGRPYHISAFNAFAAAWIASRGWTQAHPGVPLEIPIPGPPTLPGLAALFGPITAVFGHYSNGTVQPEPPYDTLLIETDAEILDEVNPDNYYYPVVQVSAPFPPTHSGRRLKWRTVYDGPSQGGVSGPLKIQIPWSQPLASDRIAVALQVYYPDGRPSLKAETVATAYVI